MKDCTQHTPQAHRLGVPLLLLAFILAPSVQAHDTTGLEFSNTRLWETSPFDNQWMEPIVVDIDGDGDADIVAFDRESSFFNPRLDALRNDNGAWTETILHEGVGVRASDLIAADLDGQAEMDLAWAGNLVAVHAMTNHAGNLEDSIAYVSTTRVTDVAAGDLDGDGVDDLIVGERGRLTVLLNKDASWTPVTVHAVGGTNWYTGIQALDLDDDGDLDLVAGIDDEKHVKAWTNDGTGTTWTMQSPQGASGDRFHATSQSLQADLDGDGDQDLVWYSNHGSNQDLFVAENEGGLAFHFVDEIPNLNGEPGLVDADGDGDLDLFLDSSNDPRIYRFDAWTQWPTWTCSDCGSGLSLGFTAGLGGDADLHRIGRHYLEAVAVTKFPEALPGVLDHVHATASTVHPGQTAEVQVYLHDNLGNRIPDSLEFTLTGSLDLFTPRNATALDGSALVQVPIQSAGLTSLEVHAGNQSLPAGRLYGQPRLAEAHFNVQLPSPAQALFLADMDHDDALDLVYHGSHGEFRILRNTGGTFAITSSLNVTDGLPAAPSDHVPPVDLDVDGDLDVLWHDGDRVHVFTNDGTGDFTVQTLESSSEVAIHAARVLDIDGSGIPEIVALRETSGLSAWKLQLDGSYEGMAFHVSLPGVRSTMSHVLDWNQDGHQDFAYTARDDIRIAYGKPGGGFDLRFFIDGPRSNAADWIRVHDLDGDGDQDVLYGNPGDFSQEGTYVSRNDSGLQTASRIHANGARPSGIIEALNETILTHDTKWYFDRGTLDARSTFARPYDVVVEGDVDGDGDAEWVGIDANGRLYLITNASQQNQSQAPTQSGGEVVQASSAPYAWVALAAITAAALVVAKPRLRWILALTIAVVAVLAWLHLTYMTPEAYP